MKTNLARSRKLLWRVTLVWVLLSASSAPIALADDAAVIPLPPDVAKDLEILGTGVVGKALPAPPITDIYELLNLGSGIWDYKIVHGGKAGQEVRSETYEKLPGKDGSTVWKRTIGTKFVEYLTIETNHDYGKNLEDDLDVGYSSRFLPGMIWLGKTEAGVTRTIDSKIEAFKTGKPDHISYSGKLTAKLSYVGQYEVTTPAGTWPAILARSAYDIKVGPADVTDTAYMFFAKGVGKIAEVEATRVSAMLVYHSNTKVAKLLTKYPKR